MIAVVGIGIAAALLALQLRELKPEYGTYLALAAGLLIFGMTTERLAEVIAEFALFESYIHLDSVYISAMLKMIGITYLSEFSCNICRDAGYHTISGQIEIFSKIMILAMSMPIVTAFMETIQNFL